MAGTGFRNCPECNERSRDNRVWWCPYCDYNKPKRMLYDVEPLRISERAMAKLKKTKPEVAAKIQRKMDEDKLAADIDKLRKPRPDVISGLRLKSGLRKP